MNSNEIQRSKRYRREGSVGAGIRAVCCGVHLHASFAMHHFCSRPAPWADSRFQTWQVHLLHQNTWKHLRCPATYNDFFLPHPLPLQPVLCPEVKVTAQNSTSASTASTGSTCMTPVGYLHFCGLLIVGRRGNGPLGPFYLDVSSVGKKRNGRHFLRKTLWP